MGVTSLEIDREMAAAIAQIPDKELPPLQENSEVTPMMAQYVEIKSANPDSLLFYRMGDFYELFFEDAETASRALGIALTKRGHYHGRQVPMCGVPVHSSEEYLQRLIRLGHKISICEQLEDPSEAKKRGAKSVVRRGVVRLVTPGTLTEESLLEPRQSNYLACLSGERPSGQKGAPDGFALAWLDISTGLFHVVDTNSGHLDADLARINPSELLVPDKFLEDEDFRCFLRGTGVVFTPLPIGDFDPRRGEEHLCRFFNLVSLESYGHFSPYQIGAASALLSYVDRTQRGSRPAVSAPHLEKSRNIMRIDQATRHNLEIVKTLRGEFEGSLLSVIDCTLTAAGGRLLADRLSSPLTDAREIVCRLDSVSFFLEGGTLCDDVRAILKGTPDMLRSLGRLSFGRAGPRDLGVILKGLKHGEKLAASVAAAAGGVIYPDPVEKIIQRLSRIDSSLVELLEGALAAELPLRLSEGGFVRSGYHAELEEVCLLRDESRKVIVSLQSRYSEETGIKTLKVKHNGVLGYFIEVTAQYGSKLLEPPFNQLFIHRQTMANNVRFSTIELSALETRIAEAGARALSIEAEIFEMLRQHILDQVPLVKDAAAAMAELDLFSSLAVLAGSEGYVRPLVDQSLAFSIEGGCHPVVMSVLKRQGQPFVPNDCNLGYRELGEEADPGENRWKGGLWLITGPNMAGKSTFLRQNALIAILAQIGSYVPARSAHIGVVDHLFSRVGAADDLARGRSTFMVEMVETAAILNQAGERALVILDEIGRGTSTFDGLSIAWACVEHLHEVNKSRGLFATHFHELTQLAQQFARVSNASMKVREWEEGIIFLHEVVSGAADRSYGIHVAQRAGLPAKVIERANEILRLLEDKAGSKGHQFSISDLPLFSEHREPPVKLPEKKLFSEPARPLPPPLQDLLGLLKDTDADDLTPRQALEFVFRLKQIAGEVLP